MTIFYRRADSFTMRELFPSENQNQSHPSRQPDKSCAHSLEAKKIWGYICEELHSQLGEETYKKWIFPIYTHSSTEDELILIVPSIQFYQVILSEYLELIERCKNKLGFEHISTVIDLDKNVSSGSKDSTLKEKNSLKVKKIKVQKKCESKVLSDNKEYTNSGLPLNFNQPSFGVENHQLPQRSEILNEHSDSCSLIEKEQAELQEEIVGWGKIESINTTETDSSSVSKLGSETLFSHTLSRKTKLNPNYTFETFVRGPSNQFALAACYNVAENPGKTYNPLFIYGATGLGKTHLLHAVGNHILKTNPNATIAYISSERFMNELIYCLRHNKIIDFRQKYRHCDLFLMDDIQFISGNKAATQEEFFHTFNTLYEAKKQIIITSDLFPQDIPDIEERLRNRFQWGLIADIQPPDIEHRIAILFSKAEQLEIQLSMDVAEYIANLVKRNVRELEGALHRLAAFAALHGRPLDKVLAVETFSNMLSEESSKPHMLIDAVQKIVAEHFQIKTSELKSKRRHKALTLPRQIAMYLSRKFTKTSFPEIGEKFGGKDHTTVMHAVRKITQERKKNMDLIVHLEALERVLERLH